MSTWPLTIRDYNGRDAVTTSSVPFQSEELARVPARGTRGGIIFAQFCVITTRPRCQKGDLFGEVAVAVACLKRGGVNRNQHANE